MLSRVPAESSFVALARIPRCDDLCQECTPAPANAPISAASPWSTGAHSAPAGVCRCADPAYPHPRWAGGADGGALRRAGDRDGQGEQSDQLGVNAVAVTADGERVVVGRNDGTVNVWDLTTNEEQVLQKPAFRW